MKNKHFDADYFMNIVNEGKIAFIEDDFNGFWIFIPDHIIAAYNSRFLDSIKKGLEDLHEIPCSE